MAFWNKVKNTDEDEAIKRLKGHKDTITCVVEILNKSGIEANRSEKNCRNGDFTYSAERSKVEKALDRYFEDDKIKEE